MASEEAQPRKDKSAPEGEVSEVSSLDAAARSEPISPHDATAGYPGDEAGAVQEGAAGPDGPAGEQRR